MSTTLSIRLPEELAEWLRAQSRRTGIAQGQIVREELARARASSSESEPRLLRHAGVFRGGDRDVSVRKGFSEH
ncbi:MAG TPA: ribbon-helix-helix domain-containing protein [Terriglobales bacterium]|nr:ribbon-helix-helix domain-containing protein [Terriglobales bacterium]